MQVARANLYFPRVLEQSLVLARNNFHRAVPEVYAWRIFSSVYHEKGSRKRVQVTKQYRDFRVADVTNEVSVGRLGEGVRSF